jgi:hypothetical protein
LILAVLAVMLSLPSQHSSATPCPTSSYRSNPEPTVNEGIWGYVTPKKVTQALADVLSAKRDVAQREARSLAVRLKSSSVLLAVSSNLLLALSAFPPPSPRFPPLPPIKEVVKEADLAVPSWMDNARARAEDIFERELKIAEREREISRREESVNRREHGASRRESWIMEQLA